MLKSSYEVEVLINGKPAKEYYHDSNTYIEGRQGTKFSIKVRNNSYSRKLFVPTIDGLSVMNGEEGSYKSSGYIVNGYSSITIDGWRTSDKDVAEFFFSSPEGSYRKQLEKGNNLGVIGVAVFDEVYHAPTYTYSPCYHTHYQQQTCYPSYWGGTGGAGGGGVMLTAANNADGVIKSSNAQAMNMQASSNSSDQMLCSAKANNELTQALGTGFGSQKQSEVTSVEFERKGSPDAIFEIHYNTREELEKAGICFKKEPLYVTPQAFPGQYCKPPKCNQHCSVPECTSCKK